LGAAPVSGGVVAACCADAEPAIAKNVAIRAKNLGADFVIGGGMWS
jgi:hypothetical protein